MRICYSLVCVCLCLVFAGCGKKDAGNSKKQGADKSASSTESLIVGTWVMPDLEDGPKFVYADDGTFKMEFGPGLPAQTGKYSINDGTMMIEWDESSQATTKKHELKVVVTEDTMTTTDKDGKEEKLSARRADDLI